MRSLPGRFSKAIKASTGALFLVLLTVSTASAQLQIAELSRDGDQITLEYSFDWDTSLREFVDSSSVQSWDYPRIDALTGGLLFVSHTLELSSYALPGVRIVSQDFDEVQVDVTAVLDEDIESRPEVWAAGLGLQRKQPHVNIVALSHRLDRSTSTLRRVRRMVVVISLGRDEGPFAGELLANKEAQANSRVVESALSSGQIFRVSITSAGVYRIDRALLQSLGLTPDTIDPSSVQVYGNGGRPLEALAGTNRIDDLFELPVERSGAGDGRFDSADFVLFYASKPSGWGYEDGSFEHFVHPFSNDNAVFLKIGSTGRDINESPAPGASSAPIFTSTEGRHFVDLEEFLWSREHGSGHDWMSRTIPAGGQRSIYSDLTLPGMMAGTIQFDARVAIASNPRATVAMISDGVVLGQRTAPNPTQKGSEFNSASVTTFSFLQPVTGGQSLNLTMQLLNQSNDPEAALDWVRITYEQNLVASEDLLQFSTRPNQTSEQRFQLDGFNSEPRVWDVTGGLTHHAYQTQASSGDYIIHVPVIDGGSQPRDIIAFAEDAILSLESGQIRPVLNQNLHGLSNFPDFVIVTNEEFLNAANRLAAHRTSDGLDVVVVTQEQVFNEFSGGVPDVRAIRDYMKFLYDRGGTNAQRPDYLLLFGDGHYDYRRLSGFQNPLGNWIFPFETEATTTTPASYTSDDYFGLLDDDEGMWPFISIFSESEERLDIGIGRFPVQSASEAELMVDKVIAYDDPSTYGSWRTNYMAIADDGPTGLAGTEQQDDLHLTNIDQVTELITDQVYPQINMQKIYGETYDRVFLNGFRQPDARKAILDGIDRGVLIFNYSGHGGPNGLAQEAIFTRDDAGQLTNGDMLPIVITATCSFGWWDLEDEQSGAEVMLLNPNGGAIALFTAVRLAYTSSSPTSLNAGLNRALNEKLFAPDAGGLPKRLGDVLRETKNTNVGLQGNSRKFNLLGDPSMRIGIPPRPASVDLLKDVSLSSNTGQMKALDRVTIDGSIKTSTGVTDVNFNGTVSVAVFDAERQVPLLVKRFSPKPYFRQREDLLWRGDVKATAGQFRAEFVVPKDISYSDEPGRIAVYAQNNTYHATGFSENFLVGGTSDNPPDDAAGPDIRLFLNDSTFVDGGAVDGDPELIVKLFDESGINTVGTGVGHEMLLSLDEEDQSAVDIGSAFVAEENSFQRGEIRWNLSDLEAGSHSLSVRAWDVLNNSNTAELSFSVANDEVLNVTNVYNYPNPMNRETRFIFEHNQPPGTEAEVQIRIYTLSGRPIRTIHSDEALPEGVLGSGPLQVYWDGKDDDLDRPATGVYLYRIKVAVENQNGERQVSEHVEKLAIIR